MASATMAQPTTKRSLRSAAAPPTKVDIEAASWSGRITHVSPFVTEEEEAQRRLQTLGTSESRAAANMTRLIADLLDGYDRQVPPLGTTVRVQLALQSIPTFVDTQKQTIEIYGWWRYYWTDHRLAWSKDDYGGIEEATMFYKPPPYPIPKIFFVVYLLKPSSECLVSYDPHFPGNDGTNNPPAL